MKTLPPMNLPPEGRVPRGLPSRRGFTLIELLLGVVIFGLVLLAVQGVFHGALRLRNKTVAALEDSLPLQEALAVLRHDLANLVPPGGALSGALQTTTSMTNTAGQVGPFLYTAVGVPDELRPWSEIHRVAYLLVQPTNETLGLDLVRSVTRNVLSTATDDSTWDEHLLGGVENLTFLFYDGTQWRQDWDSTLESNAIPAAIKVQLLLSSSRTNRLERDPIELVVILPAQAATNSTSTTTLAQGGEGATP